VLLSVLIGIMAGIPPDFRIEVMTVCVMLLLVLVVGVVVNRRFRDN
jgi:choline-glycine betaine transporter